jgi:predicted Zn-dependent protease
MIHLRRLILSSHQSKALLALLMLGLLNVPPTLAVETLDAMVNRANGAAEKQDYSTAISLYEQAIKKAPHEATLRKNLAILYANYGVDLHDKKKDPEALIALDKALALAQPDSREWRNIREAKASIFFAQAVELKDGSQNPTPADFAQMKAWLNQALALNPQEVAFKKTMAGVYGDEAYQAAQQEKYEASRALLMTGLTFDPTNKMLNQSLANVYLGLAKQDAEHRKEWIDKAVAIDSSPKVQQIGQRLLQGSVSTSGTSATGSFANQPNEAQAVAPRDMSKLSVADMVSDMEGQLQIQPTPGEALPDRLEAVEKQVLGKSQTGPLATRTKTLYTNLMGSYDGTLAQSNTHLAQAPLSNSANTYLADIFKVTDGKIVRWGKFPLRVYIDTPPKTSALYKPEYRQAVLDGFTTWKSQTDGFINFVEVKNQTGADIVVNWTEHYIDRFANPDETPTLYKTYTPPKRTKLMSVVQMASMFTPGYFSLAPQAMNAAMQYQMAKKLQVIQDESKISLGLSATQNLTPEAAKLLVQNMAAKEFGHALGLKGNSPQTGDLLYPELRSDSPQLPSTRDVATLREIYNRPPNILLNVH